MVKLTDGRQPGGWKAGFSWVLAGAIGFSRAFILDGIMIATSGLLLGWLFQRSVWSIGFETQR